MTEDYATCSLCMEAYDLEERIPMSLDCRHYFCAPCLTSHLKTQNCCPSCRRQIDNTDNIAKDQAMIDYLEIQQERKRKEQQNAMREELQRLVNTKEKEHGRIEEEINYYKSSKLIMTKDKRCAYSTYAKYLLKKSLDYCNSETNLPRMTSKYELEMEDRLQEVRISLTKMKSLLGKDYIAKEDFDNCQLEATRTSRTKNVAANAESRMWDAYREMLLEQLTEISKEPINGDPDFIPGNIAHIITHMSIFS